MFWWQYNGYISPDDKKKQREQEIMDFVDEVCEWRQEEREQEELRIEEVRRQNQAEHQAYLDRIAKEEAEERLAQQQHEKEWADYWAQREKEDKVREAHNRRIMARNNSMFGGVAKNTAIIGGAAYLGYKLGKKLM